jgi:ribonuclease BN (tRNA processing enzyme)
LLIEATLPEVEPDPDDRGHLTPFEAGEHGARARAKRLVLTHYAAELPADWLCAEAARAYDGPVVAAVEDAVYEI